MTIELLDKFQRILDTEQFRQEIEALTETDLDHMLDRLESLWVICYDQRLARQGGDHVS